MKTKQKTLPGIEPKPRRKPRKLMHVIDAGPGDCVLEPGEHLARFGCKRCGHESEWLVVPGVTYAKRGIPCPKCN